jgi:hypothetical protein
LIVGTAVSHGHIGFKQLTKNLLKSESQRCIQDLTHGAICET